MHWSAVLLLAQCLSIQIFDAHSMDPECYMTVPEITRYYGYNSEVHIVRTEDDYLLELHRIRSKTAPSKADGVVFMQHGLLADGFNFTPNLKNESAAFVFANAGFDIWIGNSRGTPSSQKHVGYGPEDDRFWNFTFQEMSQYDLTACVKYILQESKQNGLYYIGHSQGTVIMFAKLSEDPEFAKKIYQFHALAPVATVSHIGGLFKLMGAKFLTVAQVLLKRVANAPLTIPKFIQKIMSYFCSLELVRNVCTLDIGFVDGTEKLFNFTRVGVYLCHTPAATSIKNLVHWIQQVENKQFQKFDYGEKGNVIAYGQSSPPVYNLSNIHTPTFLYWSKDDILADTEDIRDAIFDKMNKTIAGSYELPHYTHLDFVFGLPATDDIYKPIIARISEDVLKRKKSKHHFHLSEITNGNF